MSANLDVIRLVPRYINNVSKVQNISFSPPTKMKTDSQIKINILKQNKKKNIKLTASNFNDKVFKLK